MTEEPQKTQKTGTFDALGRASTMGLHMVSGIFVGTLMGYGLDRWLDTFPWCSGVGLVFGVAAGFRNVWIDAQYLLKQEERYGKKR